LSIWSWCGPTPAEEKAVALLQDNLTRAQRKQWKKSSWFDVIGSHTGRTYRIKPGRFQNVYLLDDEEKAVQGFCFSPQGLDLAGDIMLGQKIALENYENVVLEIANEFIPGAPFG
jgi:hypothetical protein